MSGPDERPRLTAPCGLCCADCIPSRREFFGLLRSLDAVLEQYHMEEYAALKAKTVPALRDYDIFTGAGHAPGGGPAGRWRHFLRSTRTLPNTSI